MTNNSSELEFMYFACFLGYFVDISLKTRYPIHSFTQNRSIADEQQAGLGSSYPRKRRRPPQFDRLVKAAEDLFSQQGYRSTTIKDIAQSAGLSVGAFYIYFRSKYQIYVYIMQSFALRLQNYLDSRAGKITGDLIERQVEYIMEFIGFAYKNPACYNLIFESLYIDRDLFLQYYYQYAQRYVPALTKSRALPEGMDPMLWSFINMGIGNFIGLKVLAENDAGPEQMEKIRQTLRILLRSGLSKAEEE